MMSNVEPDPPAYEEIDLERNQVKDKPDDHCSKMCALTACSVIVILFTSLLFSSLAYRISQQDHQLTLQMLSITVLNRRLNDFTGVTRSTPSSTTTTSPLAGMNETDVQYLSSQRRSLRLLLKALKDKERCKTEGDSVKCLYK